MTAPTADLPRISRYTASRDQPCTSGQDCAGVKAGERAAYVGWTTGSGAVCASCLDEIDALVAAGDQPPTEQAGDPLADGPMPADPFLPEQRQADELCTCNRGADRAGFSNSGTAENQRWVHNTCGKPAYASGEVPLQAEPDEDTAADEDARGGLNTLRALVKDYDLAGSAEDRATFRRLVGDVLEHLDDQTVVRLAATELCINVPPTASRSDVLDVINEVLVAMVEGDDPADEPQPDDVHECECKRVTSRAKFGRTRDGRPTHEHCGGVLRDKHRHLAQTDNDQSETEPTEAETDDRDDAAGDQPAGPAPAADPGADPGAGVEAGAADGAAGAGEAGGEGGDGAGEGDHGGDQGGDLPPGPRGGDHPEPVRVEAVEAVADRDVAVRLDGVQEGVPGGVRPLGEEVRELAPGRDGLTPQAPGGLAAFYAQPAGEDDDQAPGAGSLAAFYGQPSDEDLTEDELAQNVASALSYSSNYDDYGRPFTAPDSDNYLGEFHVGELLDELGRRLFGQITALIVDVGEPQPRVFEVPR